MSDKDIPFLAVLANVEPLNLLLLGDTQANRCVHQLQDDERPDDRQSPAARRRDKLPDECSAALQQAQWLSARQVLHGARGENPGQYRSQRPTNSVDTEGIERIVVFELGLEPGAGRETH